MRNNIFSFLLLVALLYSCIPHKKTVLLQNSGTAKDSIPHYEVKYKIQPQDRVLVQVSSFNKELTEFYNMKETEGYKVGESGYIHIPMLDSIYVQGLTIAEMREKVTQTIARHVNQPYVVVRLLNFKVTFLGEVAQPGVLTTTDDDITIFEAIAQAGDFTQFGDRKNVKLVRDMGKAAEIINLDLTQRDIIENKYFYLQPGDLIYVEPLRAKSFRVNYSQVTMVLSAVSFLYIIVNFARSFR